ncbi:hypothetical protein BC826DRAFT_1189513 [Russula brevipes]|nr:hypothetical protein BC826DRAFT_1189513 [Russula brevipes]
MDRPLSCPLSYSDAAARQHGSNDFTLWANKHTERDVALRTVGAIISAKTNVPQTLLAADGAALDVGSDIRILSGYCGVLGLKSGQVLVAFGGMFGASVGQGPGELPLSVWRGSNPALRPSAPSWALPMGRSAEVLERMACVLFGVRGGNQDYLPGAGPVPRRGVTLPEKLRFEYYLNVKGSPACHRAILETAEALRKAGHECVEIESPDSAQALRLFT